MDWATKGAVTPERSKDSVVLFGPSHGVDRRVFIDIAASLLFSTTNATTFGPKEDMVWDHFKTASGKVCNGILDESTRFQFFKGPVNFSTPQLPRVSRSSCR